MAVGDRLSNARQVGVLNGRRTFKNSVGLRDKNDYYALTISGRSSFNLRLSGLQNNVDVSLIQSGQTIASSNRKNRQSEKIVTTLEAGTYYVRVAQKRGSSRYQLSLTANPLAQPIAPSQSAFADSFYTNVFLSASSDAYSCGLFNDPTSCAAYLSASSVLSDGCAQGNRTACSLGLELLDIEITGRLTSMIR
jgi:Bacterial pre-peptidase C-terminal domain